MLKIPDQEPERHHQRLQHYRKELEIPHQEPHLLFHPGTQLLLGRESSLLIPLGSHQMHRITRPPVQGPIQASGELSTARTPKEHRGRPPGHVCGFRIHRWIPISGLGGGNLGNQNPQQNTKMSSTPWSSITRDRRIASIWDHRNIITWTRWSISDWAHWINIIWDHGRITWDHHINIIWDHWSIIWDRWINIIWYPQRIAIWGRLAIIAPAQHRDRPSAE